MNKAIKSSYCNKTNKDFNGTYSVLNKINKAIKSSLVMKLFKI